MQTIFSKLTETNNGLKFQPKIMDKCCKI